MTRLFRVAALLLVAGLATAQTTTSTTTTTTKSTHSKKKEPKKKAPTTAEELEAMRAQMREQQTELDALKGQLADRDQQVGTATQATATAQQTAADAKASADAAAVSSQAAQQQVTTLQGTVTDLKTTDQGLQETVVANQAKTEEEINSPLAIHYKGVAVTPVAFFAGEGVFRERSVNSDVNTPFNSIPFPSAVEGHTSELNFSGRQSRIGALIEGKAAGFTLSGYWEGDFLGTGTSSNNNQSNSYVYRQRVIYGRAETAGGFAVTGGQMWSLVTEDGVGTNNRTEKLPNTIDSQYMVGYSWERQPSFRIQQRFGDVKTGALTVALAAEQAQITNFTANGTNPADYFFAGPGQNGGLYNAAAGAGNGNAASSSAITTYANNVAPDIIVKAAVDIPHAHFELGALARFMRDFFYPVASFGGAGTSTPTFTYTTTSLLHQTTTGGGVFGSIRVSPVKFVDLAVQGMAGDGTGRYGSAQLADATLKPDETLEPIRNFHGLLSIETHPAPKLDVFMYYGGEYAQRTVYTTPAGFLIGYGPRNLNDAGCYLLPAPPTTAGTGGAISSPSTCASPTRYVEEGMIGFTYRVASSPRYGRLQYSGTYSYVQRNLWSGTVSTATFGTPTGPRAVDNMVHMSMRYYIP
jgi:hypothetical protein